MKPKQNNDDLFDSRPGPFAPDLQCAWGTSCWAGYGGGDGMHCGKPLDGVLAHCPGKAPPEAPNAPPP
ncbi:hypothetical protein FE257_006926 [Aspergillus nanangensis]|uniref:Uncharacterized protein n=1 Tax=Aspergillus nanangensis TaxID=2582783 RepID=A0AAD4CNN6_ASPNN|nr:hypothetical protein FE257_006926 [Aspergillus nanangensis]